MVKVEIGGGHTGDKPRPAAESHVLDCPFHEDHDAALKLDDIHQVDEGPYYPRRQTPKMYAEDICDCGCPSDNCKISFVKVAEWSLFWLTLYFPHDRFSRVRPLLHRDLRHALQRLA